MSYSTAIQRFTGPTYSWSDKVRWVPSRVRRRTSRCSNLGPFPNDRQLHEIPDRLRIMRPIVSLDAYKYAAPVFCFRYYMYANSSAALMTRRALLGPCPTRTTSTFGFRNSWSHKSTVSGRKALGFRSKTEFIADAIRRRLEQILELEATSARRKWPGTKDRDPHKDGYLGAIL